MSGSPWSVVLRAVFPTSDVDAVLPLYIDGDASAATVRGRHGIGVANGTVSLGSYFNAFPAATWQAETDADTVRLRVHAAGRGSILIHRSDADARATEVARRDVDSDCVITLDLPLHGFDSGGVYWFDLVANGGELQLLEADWSIEQQVQATATVAITTFNRPVECLAQLRALALDQGVGEVIDRIILVDQGSDTVQSQPEFPAVATGLGERLSVIRQPNLGGSGGFARGMLETLRTTDSDGVLLLDDDAIIEPEAIVRAVRFAGAARSSLIVGGGMIHLDDRSRLYAQSEQWDSRIGWFRLDRPGAYDHDFVATPFRQAPFFHRTHRSDFNGWWMCLIPVSVLRAGGLPLPLFLKGDDVEFGLRAGARGVRTVSPTGIALWHLGWGGKAPTRTWEGYFLHRNRLITELLHATASRPTTVILHSFLGDMKPLLTLQYSAVRLRAQAVADVLAGPERLPGWLALRAEQVRALWQRYPDAAPVSGMTAPRATPQPHRGRIGAAVTAAAQFLRQMLTPVRGAAVERPTIHVTADALDWSTFARVDSALVDSSDGRTVTWYRRDRRESYRAFWRSLRLHLRLWMQWPHLARRFRAHAPYLASPEAWARVFEGS